MLPPEHTSGNKNKWQAIVLLLLFVAPLALYFFVRTTSRPVHRSLPYQYELVGQDTNYFALPPTFTLATQTGDDLRRDDILGDSTVVLVSFTNLARNAPNLLLLENLQAVQKNIVDAPQFRMLTVATNAPDSEQLAFWADTVKAVSGVWQFVSTTPEAGAAFARTLGIPDLREQPAGAVIDQAFTANASALVDWDGRVRKYYGAAEKYAYDVAKVLPEDLIVLYRLEYQRKNVTD